MDQPNYSNEPGDARSFSDAFDRFYSRFAPAYDALVKWLPTWRRWLGHALPELAGPRVLEVAFGTGWLMTQYADRFEVHGIDRNPAMVATARRNLHASDLHAELHQGNVESMPFPDGHFDTVLCTMAFSGFPDADGALREMLRVLAPDGRLVMIDINYPENRNAIGSWFTALWKQAGDVIRDMHALLSKHDLEFMDREIGGRGSVHLYVASRRSRISEGAPTTR